MVYRCPVDDCVFTTQKIDRVPTLEGHPECPGPECRKNFRGFQGAAKVEPIVAPVSKDAANGVSALDAAPVGQGW